MLPVNPIEQMDVYASNSQYIQGPSPAQQAQGTVPLDTLPADWWNWLWKSITERINEASAGMESLYEEVISVLTAASIEPSQLQSDQLLNAIKALARVTGTTAIAGAVKSSTDSGKVSIDENGIMTVNGLGIPTSLNTTAKNVVNAINEILSEYTSNKTTTDAAITGLQNSKAPNNHASEETTYGKGTSSTYGHVKLYDGVDSDSGSNSGVAATPAAVKALNTSLQGVCTALDSKLSTTGCAADSDKLGGTAKGGLFTDFSASGQTISATIGGVTKSATISVPSGCLGNISSYYKLAANATAAITSANACEITLGQARIYDFCNCLTDTRSYDRRTYSKIGTQQNNGACSGMTYIDTCVWQCCYSGTAGVTTCTNRRWCFCSNGNMYTPGAVEARSSTFGCMLVANRTGSANMATVMFCNCNGELGIIGMCAKDGTLQRYKTDHSTVYTILDTSAAVTVAQGGTGATCAAAARTNLGLGNAATRNVKTLSAKGNTGYNSSCAACQDLLVTTGFMSYWNGAFNDTGSSNLTYYCGGTFGSAAACAASAFRSCTWTPSCVACAGCNGSGQAFGTAAICAATAFRSCTWTPSCVACAGCNKNGVAFGCLATVNMYNAVGTGVYFEGDTTNPSVPTILPSFSGGEVSMCWGSYGDCRPQPRYYMMCGAALQDGIWSHLACGGYIHKTADGNSSVSKAASSGGCCVVGCGYIHNYGLLYIPMCSCTNLKNIRLNVPIFNSTSNLSTCNQRYSLCISSPAGGAGTGDKCICGYFQVCSTNYLHGDARQDICQAFCHWNSCCAISCSIGVNIPANRLVTHAVAYITCACNEINASCVFFITKGPRVALLI